MATIPAPARPRATPSSVFSKIVNMLKSVPQDQLDDVTDTIDHATTPGDQWQTNYRQPNQAENPVGPNQAMQGTGVDKFVADYSDTTATNENSPAAILGKMVERMETLEKSMIAMASVIGLLCKSEDDDKRFDGDGEAKEDKDDEAAKSGIHKLSISDMMSTIGNRLTKKAAEARERENRAVATPPSMLSPQGRAIQKSNFELISDRLSEDEAMPLSERISLRLRANAARMRAEGASLPETDLRSRMSPQNF
jgi:hypothetical protein